MTTNPVRTFLSARLMPNCVDSAGHRFKADMIRGETAVCERCGLIRKDVVRA
jgi:hypothetical protein